MLGPQNDMISTMRNSHQHATYLG